MTESRKTCTNLASATNQSHDKIYREFESPTQKSNQIRNQLIDIVKEELSGKLKYLLFDDSQLSKPHANEIEGIDICFDGSTGRPELGLQIVDAIRHVRQVKTVTSTKSIIATGENLCQFA